MKGTIVPWYMSWLEGQSPQLVRKKGVLKQSRSHRTDIQQPGVVTWMETHTWKAFAWVCVCVCVCVGAVLFTKSVVNFLFQLLLESWSHLADHEQIKHCWSIWIMQHFSYGMVKWWMNRLLDDNRWMDGWIQRQVGGWKVGLIVDDRWKNGRTDEWINRWLEGWWNRWMDGSTDETTNRWMTGWIAGRRMKSIIGSWMVRFWGEWIYRWMNFIAGQ